MQAGSLRCRVTLKRPHDERDATGHTTHTWVTYATVWAKVRVLKGRELLYAQQAGSKSTVEIEIRYLSAVDHSHRVIYGTHTYEINHVADPDQRKRSLVLLCSEAT